MDKPTRKVIRLTTVVGMDETEEPIALCDDGTMWRYDGEAWQELPDIPQPE